MSEPQINQPELIAPATPAAIEEPMAVAEPTETTEEAPAPKGKPRKSLWREILETVLLTVVIFLVVKSVVANFRIEGSSMEPNFHTNQLVMVSKASYFHFNINAWIGWIPGVNAQGDSEVWPFGGPHRGDVVVLEPPDAPTDDYIKRVIGLPGDKIEVKDGQVYLNDKPLAEPYIREKIFSAYGPVIVPNGSIFVMGDNRNASRDSRSFGFLPFDKVVGKAMIVYWPAGKGWGPIADPQYK